MSDGKIWIVLESRAFLFFVTIDRCLVFAYCCFSVTSTYCQENETRSQWSNRGIPHVCRHLSTLVLTTLIKHIMIHVYNQDVDPFSGTM